MGWPSAPPPPSQATRVLSVSTISGASTGMGMLGLGEDGAGSYKLRFGGQGRDLRMVTLGQNLHKNRRFRRNRAGRRQPRFQGRSLRIAAIGAVDETNCAIGVARLDAEGDTDAMLARIQNDLFDLGADLCAPEDGRKAEGALADRRGAGGAAGTRDRRHECEAGAADLFCPAGRHGAGGASASGPRHRAAGGSGHGGAGGEGNDQPGGAALCQPAVGSSVRDGAHRQ